MRKRLIAIVLALMMVAGMPNAAKADSAVDWYNNLAQCLGIGLDVASQAWTNKTKAAYIAYLEQEGPYVVTTPNSIYASGQRLEDLTGYDVVSSADGVLYLNTAMDPHSAGGAFGSIRVNWTNYSSLMRELLDWFRIAVENGPTWPNASASVGGGDIGQSWPNAISVSKIVGEPFVTNDNNYLETQMTFNTSVKTSFTEKMLTYPYAVIFLGRKNNSGSTKIEGYVYWSKQPIAITYEETGNFNASNKLYKINVTGEDVNANKLTLSNVTTVTAYGAQYTSTYLDNMLWVSSNMGASSGGGIADDTPPASGGDTNITITWPDINYTGPTYNYEGDTYNTTTTYDSGTGRIDLSPITDRLDELALEQELYFNSFESFRADFLEYMAAFRSAFQDLVDEMNYMNSYLRRMLDKLIAILNKIPTGTSSTAPNADDDEEGFWAWIARMLQRIIGSLPEVFPADFISALNQLTGKFPFSVPFDMAAIMAVMSQDPLTPEFNITMPTIGGTSSFVHVDLHSLDELASIVRKAVLMWFTLILASGTYETLKGMDWSLFD